MLFDNITCTKEEINHKRIDGSYKSLKEILTPPLLSDGRKLKNIYKVLNQLNNLSDLQANLGLGVESLFNVALDSYFVRISFEETMFKVDDVLNVLQVSKDDCLCARDSTNLIDNQMVIYIIIDKLFGNDKCFRINKELKEEY